ncbi:hypothetical protein D3C86_2176650 [compost metagenome]
MYFPKETKSSVVKFCGMTALEKTMAMFSATSFTDKCFIFLLLIKISPSNKGF